MARHRPDSARRLQPIQARHVHVHQDQVDIGASHALDRLQTVAGHRDLHARAAQQLDTDLLVHRVVLHHQHARAGVLTAQHRLDIGRGQRRFQAGRVADIEPRGEPELAARARLARHTDFSAHQPDQLAGDHQAQAGAAETPGGRGIGLNEGGEELIEIGRRNSDAGIANHESHAHPLAVPLLHPGRHIDAPALGELHRIAEQIDQRLQQAGRVAAQHIGHPVGRAHDVQPLVPGALGHQRAAARHHAPERKIDHFEFEFSRLDLGQVEDVVDHLRQVHRRLGHLAQALDLNRAAGIAPHQMG